MKPLITAVAVAGALMSPASTLAFDVRSPNPDFELRERSERLHVTSGSTFASAPRRGGSMIAPTWRTSPGAKSNFRYENPRERALRGHDD